MLISSLQNERIKNAVKLRDRRGRDRQKTIIIDGQREIGLALASGIGVETLFICEDLCDDQSHTLIEQARSYGLELLFVTRPVMEKLAFGDRAEGLIALAETPKRTLTDFTDRLQLPSTTDGPQPLIAVVEGVEKPGNLGAILRTADAAGLAGVIVAGGATDLFNPNAIRASLGAIFTVPLAAAEATTIRQWLRDQQFGVVAAWVDGPLNYTEADYTGRRAIVLGSEAHGLTDVWRGDDLQRVRLPMLGQVDSLNLSATAAILFYEALRHRTAS